MCPSCNNQIEYKTKYILDRSIKSKSVCVKCSNKNKFYTSDSFVNRAKSVHGEKFDYSNAIYKRWNEKIKIGCKKCENYFFQSPNSHLNGRGCPNCKKINFGNRQRTGHDEYIKKMYFCSWRQI